MSETGIEGDQDNDDFTKLDIFFIACGVVVFLLIIWSV